MSSSRRSKLSCCSSSSSSQDAADGGRDSRDKMDDVFERREFLPNDASIPIDASDDRSSRHKDDSHHFDVNMYASKKSAANGLMDLALLMANASQLKHIIVQGPVNKFYHVMLTLIIGSIILQVVIGLALLYLVRIHVTEDETDTAGTARSRRADRINNWVVASIFLLTVVNIFISAFGLGEVERNYDGVPSPAPAFGKNG